MTSPPATRFLDALARRDLDALDGSLTPTTRLRALLPAEVCELHGADAVRQQFDAWFGGRPHCEMLETAIDRAGDRLSLRWRLRVRDEAGLGEGFRIVEQCAYAAVDAAGLITRLDLLCTGFRPEGPRG